MIPLELKEDRDGLLYTDDKSLLKNDLLLDKRMQNLDDKYYVNGYFRFGSTLEYIIKYCYTVFTKQECNSYKEMLQRLIEKQKFVSNTDFPIGYFKDNKKIAGLVVKYYPNGISLEDIMANMDINLISKYYSYDEDSLRNMFLLFQNILDNVNEMFENDIYYTDIHPGNIIIDNNKVKIIDFEPGYVKFDNKDKRLREMIMLYLLLMRTTLAKYNLPFSVDESILCFPEAKRFTKKIEDRIRNR